MSAPDVEWDVEQVIAWLAGLGIGENLDVDAPVYVGPYIPDTPDLLFVVTPTSGAGEWLEGVADTSGFQLYTRGAQGQGQTATGQRLALAADRRIRFAPFPMPVAGGALRLLRVQRAGGVPTALAMDDDADRVSFTCHYLTTILR